MKHRLKSELEGKKFGRWTVLNKAVKRGNRGEVYWHCICSCGIKRLVQGRFLSNGTSLSCGCYHVDRVTTHGMTDTPVFMSWKSMLDRCTNKNDPSYPRYGGRGISVCKRWKNSFESFYFDMGERPKGRSLDRIDNESDYKPSNCRWASHSEQQRNTRLSRTAVWNGKETSIYEISKQTNVPVRLIGDRLYAGWQIDKILSAPNRKNNRR